MNSFERIEPDLHHALVKIDFSTALAILQDDPGWGVKVLRKHGSSGWFQTISQWQSGLIPSGIQPIDQNSFWALGAAGRKYWLAYKIWKTGEGQIRVEPAAYLHLRKKVLLLLALGWLHSWFALLAPPFWLWIDYRNRCMARKYLPAFCAYLESRLKDE